MAGGRGGRRWRLVAWLGGIVVLAGTAAWVWRLGGESGPVVSGAQRSRNVLLVTIDTLRADALGCYGGAARTPAIDALAARGVRFTFAHAHSVVTLPSHTNILTGLLPYQHGVRDNTLFSLRPGIPTLATMLEERGYATAAFVAAAPLDARFGLNRGFDVYSEGYAEAGGPQIVFAERSAAAVVAEALSWLRARPASGAGGGQAAPPWFCWVHLYDPHAPYEPPEPFRGQYPDRPYDGEVAAVDAALAPLLDLASAEPGTLVVLTSDHGEAFGEHGELTHGLMAYETTLHVPLVLHAPRLLRPAVLDGSASHVDIVPTVLDALGLPVPEALSGRSLLGAPPTAGREVYFEALSGMLSWGYAPLYGLLVGREKWIDLPLPELYDLARDPDELSNLAHERPTGELHVRLQARIEHDAFEAAGPVDAELRERIESLGYLTAPGATKQRYTEEDDPKRLVHLDAEMQRAGRLYQKGKVDEAIAAYERILEQRDSIGVVYGYLAHLYAQKGQLERAIELLKRGLAVGVMGSEIRTLLGGYLAEVGRPAEALSVLEPVLGREPVGVDALNVQGIALAGQGQTELALQRFAHILERDPGNAQALLNTATVHLRQGDAGRARLLLEQAVRSNPRMAEAWNALGVIAARAGQPDEAIGHWRTVLELRPAASDTHYNLGLLLARRGRGAEAREHLEAFLRSAPEAAVQDRQRVRRILETLP